MCTKNGATALVTLEEYQRLLVNDNTGMACYIVCLMLLMRLGYLDTSRTAQGGGGSFKNRKPIGEIGCCESGMAERSH